MTVKSKRTPLLLSRRFAPLFALFQTGTFNDNALKNALIGLITFGGVAFLSDLPSMIRVPTAALIFTGPFLILCAIAGQLADKFDRGVIFRWIKRAEIGIMIIAGIGFLLKDVRILAVALGLMGAQSAFFSPTKNAVMPQWLDSDELIRANGLMSGVQFAVLLLGTILGLKLIDTASGPAILAGLLFILALIGWIAAETCPPATPPNPDLKVDYNPITAIASVLRQIFKYPAVLRPWLGIAWFYGLSTIFITAFPDFIATQMQYESGVLQVVLVISTVSILIGSLTTMFIGNMKIWGPEAVRLVAVGIVGVTLSALVLYFAPTPKYLGTETFGPVSEFFKDPHAPLFLAAVAAASLFNGMFVVPLQAMAQRRAHPRIRAQLMSAGSVLYNFFVNVVTFGLIGLAALNMPAKTPFLMIVIGSATVATYAVWRCFHIADRKAYIGDRFSD